MGTAARPPGNNRGVQNLGSGTINVTGSAIGDNPAVWAGRDRPQPPVREVSQWDVGVVTVLSEETSAVTAA